MHDEERFNKDIKYFNKSVTENSHKDKMKLQNFPWKVKFMCFCSVSFNTWRKKQKSTLSYSSAQ